MLMDVITSPIIPRQPVPLSEQGRCYLSLSASFLLFNKICVAAKRNSPVSGKIAWHHHHMIFCILILGLIYSLKVLIVSLLWMDILVLNFSHKFGFPFLKICKGRSGMLVGPSVPCLCCSLLLLKFYLDQCTCTTNQQLEAINNSVIMTMSTVFLWRQEHSKVKIQRKYSCM